MKKCALLFFFLSSFVYAYPWPVKPFSGPHPINAVLGEFRVPYGSLNEHFHSGVDIGRGTNTPVYSITNGIASVEYDNQGNAKHFVKVGNYRYVHIIPAVANNTPVTAFVTIIGYIDGESHLHFEEYSGGTKLNPLASLDNYADNSMPTVWKPSFWHQSYDAQGNATNTSIPKSGLWGKIDIKARAKDAQSNGSSTVGMYSMGYAVQDKDGNIYLYKEDIVFNEIVGKIENGIGYIYDKPNCNNSLYYYWLTNKFLYTSNNAEDRYWNTKLKKGQPWNGEDARINAEAEYPDGRYWIWAFGKDIKGNGADFSHLLGADTSVVILDNFVPFVDTVQVKKGGRDGYIIYNGYWVLNGDGMQLNIPKKDSA